MGHAILCVDDEPEILSAYQRFLASNYAVTTARSADGALAALAGPTPFAVIVSDLKMPGRDGIQLLTATRSLYPDTVRILVSGQADLGDAVEAINCGHIFRFLPKPFTPAELSAAVAAAAAQYDRIASERSKAELLVRATEERYWLLFKANPHPMWVHAAGDLRVLAVNDAALALYGYGREVFVRLSVHDLDLDSDHAPARTATLRRHRTAEGTVRDVEVTTRPIEFGGQPAYLTMALDVTERVRAEAALRLRDRAIQSVSQGILITDPHQPDNPIIYASPGFERLSGYPPSEVLGRNCRFLQGKDTDPAAVARVRAAIRSGEPCTVELLNYKKDGTPFWNELSLSPVRDEAGRLTHFVGVQADVTARKQLETQLRQAQKLESIGQLAAGVAHEINTPVQYIADNTTFLGDSFRDVGRLLALYRAAAGDAAQRAEAERAAAELDLDYLLDEVPRAIHQTLEGVRHVARIVKAMKEFAHPGAEERVPFDVNHALETVVTVARNEWKYWAEVATAFDPNLPAVPGLPGELNQVFLNLLVNAAHAIHAAGRPGKGTITLTTRRAGDGVEILIADTGCGIPEAVRDRVYDPFFTTKPVGQGTGQGLALAHAVVVQRHGGAIWFESEVGRGTTFFVRLPGYGERMTGTQRIQPAFTQRRPTVGGAE